MRGVAVTGCAGRIRAAGRRPGPLVLGAVLAAVGLLPAAAATATVPTGFTAGDPVVYRVGTGSTLTSAAAAVSLDDYTPAGAVRSSTPLPTTASGSNKRLLAGGTATSEGLLNLSLDGRYLIVPGYDVAVGASAPGNASSTAAPRVVGRVDAAGAIDTTTSLTDTAIGGNNLRSATSTDGTSIWVGGAANGVAHTTLGSSTSTPLLSPSSTANARNVTIYNGQLYMSADPTKNGPASFSIASIGSGLPTSGTVAPVNLSFSAAPVQPYAFAFLTLGTGTAPDTLYVADNSAGAVIKYSLVSGVWVKTGSTAVSGVDGLAANDVAGVVTIYVTTQATTGTLSKIVDTSGVGGTLNGTATVIATAPTNEAFRGVAFAPGTTIGSGGPPPPVLPTITTSVSGLANSLGDPTNPTTVGVSVADANYSASQLTVTATSSNTAVAPQGGISVTGTGASRVLNLTPGAVGDSTITLTVTAPDATTATTTVAYGVSADDGNPTDRYYAGAGNGSGEVEVGGGYMIVVDDESNLLRLYQESTSGPAVKTYDFTGVLPVGTTEADFEGATRVGNTLYVIGSLSNSDPAGKAEPSRDIIFAATIGGSGAATTLTYVGSYTHIREDVVAWDHANGDPLGLASSAAVGVGSKSPDGFNLEGLEFAAGSTTTAYLGLRAPLESPTARTAALLVPVTNFASLVTNGNPGTTVATFGSPITMDLGGLGIRDIRKNAEDQYLIIGGTADGSNSSFALYTWDGVPADPPTLTSTPLVGVEDGAWEGIVGVPDPLVNGSTVELEQDDGGSNWYADGLTTKTGMPVPLQKDLGRRFTIALPTQTVTFGPGAPGSAPNGTSYAASATASSGLPVTLSVDPTSTAGACGISGGTLVSFTGVGTCVIDGTQAGNTAYAPAVGKLTIQVVAGTPSLTTVASAPVSAGGQITDTASLGGGGSPTGTITFDVYGPGDANCDTPLGTSTTAVAGDGNYTSAPFTATMAGVYRWVASYGGDAGNARVDGGCGDDGESVTVGPAQISGVVSDAGGNGVANICVYPYEAVTQARTSDPAACTDASGAYTLTLGAVGSYNLVFYDSTGTYVTQWYAGARYEGQATPVTVGGSGPTTGIDAVVASTGAGPQITGTVTNSRGAGVPDICAYPFDAATGARTPDPAGCTDANGAYTLSLASAGSYNVVFYDPTGTYVTQWYSGAAYEGQATPVTVGAGPTTGVDAVIGRPTDATTSITGHVTNGGGTGVANVCVYPFEATTGARTADPAACTDAAGDYTLRVGAAGSYNVVFYDATGTYATQWYAGAAYEGLATPVTVSPGAATTGVDATLTQ